MWLIKAWGFEGNLDFVVKMFCINFGQEIHSVF